MNISKQSLASFFAVAIVTAPLAAIAQTATIHRPPGSDQPTHTVGLGNRLSKGAHPTTDGGLETDSLLGAPQEYDEAYLARFGGPSEKHPSTLDDANQFALPPTELHATEAGTSGRRNTANLRSPITTGVTHGDKGRNTQRAFNPATASGSETPTHSTAVLLSQPVYKSPW